MRRGGTMRLRTGFLVHGQYPVVHLEDDVPSLVLLDYAVHHSPALAKELSSGAMLSLTLVNRKPSNIGRFTCALGAFGFLFTSLLMSFCVVEAVLH